MRTFDHRTPDRKVFPAEGKKRRERKRKASLEFCWGFCVVVCFSFGLASFLMFSAWERFSGVAWGGVEDRGNEGVVAEEGFLAFDVSDMQRDDLLAAAPLEVTEEDEPEGPVASLPAEPAEFEVRAEVSEVPLNSVDRKSVV